MGLKVNLGCGNKYIEGFQNVDLYADKVDLKADILTLEYSNASLEHILISHVLEHISLDDAYKLMNKVFKWLRPGGMVAIEVPERDKCIYLATKGRHKKRKDLLQRGVSGIMGGRSIDQTEWFNWLMENHKTIVATAKRGEIDQIKYPEKWRVPGEHHYHSWSDADIKQALVWIGFSPVCVTLPRRHGPGRDADRDCRVEGFKP